MGWLRVTRTMFRRRAAEQEMDEEFAFHIRMQTEQNLSAGMPPEEARRSAMVAFGGVDRYKERVRQVRWTRVLEDVVMDVRYALRALRRHSGWAAVAILTIAIGIGATTSVSSMLDAVLFRPLPAVAGADRLYDVTESRSGMMSDVLGFPAMPYPRYEKYVAASAAVWSGLAGHRYAGFSLATEVGAVAVNGSLTSRNYFDVLGVRPQVGRFYGETDPFAVVLSDALWRTRFGSDASVVGRTIRLDSRTFTVVGVAPPEFVGTSVGIRSDVWAPLQDYWAGNALESWDTWVALFGRLGDGVEATRARAVMQAVAVNIPAEQSWTTIRGAKLDPVTGIPVFARTPFKAFLAMLLATAVLVLLIAAGNVAGMLLARAKAREREIAIRLAVGVSRRRLVGQLLVESIVLFVIGGSAGIVLSFWLTDVLVRHLPALPFSVGLDIAPNPGVLGAALLTAAVTGTAFGLAPALRSTRSVVLDSLKKSGPGGGGMRARSFFVGAQFAMSIVLVVLGGLFVRSLRGAVATDPGFEPDGVVVGSINLRPHGYDVDRAEAFRSTLLERIRAIPGVDQAGLAEWALMSGGSNGSDVSAAEPGVTEQNRTNARFDSVDPAWLELMRVPFVSGRTFSDRDDRSTPQVVIVNETLASRLWPGQDPIGRQVAFGSRLLEVVGVTRNGKYVTIGEQPVAMIFFPFAQRASAQMTLHVRSAMNPAELIEKVRGELASIDPNVALEQTGPLPALVAMSLYPQRFAAWLIGGFGIAGLVLAMIGVYGVLAFEVARGLREFGIRGALGARPSHLVGTVVGRGLVVAGVGSLAGLMLAVAVTRLIRSFLYGVEPFDAVTFGGASALMLAVAAAAAWLPARRASAVPPVEALRTD